MKTTNLILLLPLVVSVAGCGPKGSPAPSAWKGEDDNGTLVKPTAISSRPLRSDEIERMAANGLLLAMSESFDLLRKDNERLKEHVRCLEVNQETILDLLSNFADTNAVLQKRIKATETDYYWLRDVLKDYIEDSEQFRAQIGKLDVSVSVLEQQHREVKP